VGLRRLIADGFAVAVGLAIILIGGNFMLHAPAPAAASGSGIWDRAFSPEVLEVLRLGLIRNQRQILGVRPSVAGTGGHSG
jgi:hypothetical protein